MSQRLVDAMADLQEDVVLEEVGAPCTMPANAKLETVEAMLAAVHG